MKLDFITNKYLLIWYLLYSDSFSLEVQELKQNLWKYNKKEYYDLKNEKEKMFIDLQDYIPNDDLIFNCCEKDDYYKKIKKDTNKYRLKLLELWDSDKKSYSRELNKLLKYNYDFNYTICAVYPSLNVFQIENKSHLIIIGKELTKKDKDGFLIFMIFQILSNEYNLYKPNDKNIVFSVLELIVLNELYSRISKFEKYNIGSKNYKLLKSQIYPYFLMYLGIPEEKFKSRMEKDNIYFNLDEVKYDDSLQLMDIYSFINYIIKNKEKVLQVKTFSKKITDTETL